MKKNIIERYERTNNGELIIDIYAIKIEDLFDDFDKHTTFLKKDLDHDLVEYIIESVIEIDDEKFIIQFNLDTITNQEAINRAKNGVNNFFVYMQELESRKMKSMIRTSMILFFIGVVLATFSVLMSKSKIVETSVVVAVISEGLTVAAWVSLWESLATFLIKWMPYRKKILLFKRIANSDIRFEFNSKN